MSECISAVSTHEWRQEWYPTGCAAMRRRTGALRRLNVRVTVSPMGRQVTGLGTMRLTLVDIRRNGVDECVWDTIIRTATGG